jgi:hypothetical protein
MENFAKSVIFFVINRANKIENLCFHG